MTPDPLLDAVFSSSEDVLRPALVAARRRRLIRKLTPVASVAAGLCAASALLFYQSPKTTPSAVASTTAVETITTRPLAATDVIHTSAGSVDIISTANSTAAPAALSDTELLSLFEPGRAALAGNGSDLRLVEF